MNPRHELKIRLLAERGSLCEGQGWCPHVCLGGLEMHEAFYKRNDFQKLRPRKLHDYFWDPINCVLVCASFHRAFGHRKGFREYVRVLMEARYGDEAVAEWLRNAPLRIKEK